MVKKWMIAGIAYLVVVMVAYGVYDATVEPAKKDMQEEEMNEHE